jgi:hypothetical protein
MPCFHLPSCPSNKAIRKKSTRRQLHTKERLFPDEGNPLFFAPIFLLDELALPAYPLLTFLHSFHENNTYTLKTTIIILPENVIV